MYIIQYYAGTMGWSDVETYEGSKHILAKQVYSMLKEKHGDKLRLVLLIDPE